jgi:enamine deaminase RidA (YjgF/YER057c/UK114 family)
MSLPKSLLPAGWRQPRGYANGMVAQGRMVFTGGLIGWNADEVLADSFAAQARQTFGNIVAILAEAGAGPEHLVRLTWYVVDVAEYQANLREIGLAYREVIGRHYPAMAVVQVVRLVEPNARIEIEATAVIA